MLHNSLKTCIYVTSFSNIKSDDKERFLFTNDKVIDKHSPIKTNPDRANVAAPNPVATAVCSETRLRKAFCCEADIIPINNDEPIAAASC